MPCVRTVPTLLHKTSTDVAAVLPLEARAVELALHCAGSLKFLSRNFKLDLICRAVPTHLTGGAGALSFRFWFSTELFCAPVSHMRRVVAPNHLDAAWL